VHERLPRKSDVPSVSETDERVHILQTLISLTAIRDGTPRQATTTSRTPSHQERGSPHSHVNETRSGDEQTKDSGPLCVPPSAVTSLSGVTFRY